MNDSKDKVWISVGGTINIGNYENIKIEMGESITVEGLSEDARNEIRLSKLAVLMTDFEKISQDIHCIGDIGHGS